MKRHLLVWLVVAVSTVGPRAALSAPPPAKLTIATWNLEWFFDENTGDSYSKLAREQAAPDREQWNWKRDGVAEAIAAMHPTIIALQEVENQRVLFYLISRLKKVHHLDYRIAFIQGTDYFTEQDVAILYQHGLVEYCRREQTEEMRQSKQYYNVQKHLFARFEWGSGDQRQSLHLLTAHFRAMPKGASIRQRQARLVRHWINDMVRNGDKVVVLGDFNTELAYAETVADSEMGILRATDTPASDDDLVDLHQFLPVDQRGTHLLPGKQFDRILVSRNLIDDTPRKKDYVFHAITLRKDVAVRGQQQDKDHWNIYYQIDQAERDLSDHYPLVATFELK